MLQGKDRRQDEVIAVVKELNNIGVQLLEKGHISKTLQIFKTVTSAWTKNRSASQSGVLQGALIRARETLDQVQNHYKSSDRYNAVDVRPIDHCDDALKQAAQLFCKSSMVFPLHIRTGQDACNELYYKTSDTNVTAIVLYNFGVAAWCRFANKHEERDEADALHAALQTFRTAKALLSSSSPTNKKDDSDDDSNNTKLSRPIHQTNHSDASLLKMIDGMMEVVKSAEPSVTATKRASVGRRESLLSQSFSSLSFASSASSSPHETPLGGSLVRLQDKTMRAASRPMKNSKSTDRETTGPLQKSHRASAA